MKIPFDAHRKLLLSRRGWRQLSAALLLFCAMVCIAGDTPQVPPLTTVGTKRLPGKFVWADLVTDDVAAARSFYSRLFGWTFRDFGNYHVMEHQDRPLCGMFQQEKPKDRPARPRWFAYLSVSSINQAQRAVTKAGGRVVAAPWKFPKRGEQALFTDPEGALFGVIKSSSGDPEDFLAEPGEWIWIALLSRNAGKAADFYRAVGGYEVIANSATNRLNDYILASEGFARATIRTIPKEREQVLPIWLPFVRVENVSQSAARAGELGGKTLVEPRPELYNGKVAVIADPTGAAIGIIEWSESLSKGVR